MQLPVKDSLLLEVVYGQSRGPLTKSVYTYTMLLKALETCDYVIPNKPRSYDNAISKITTINSIMFTYDDGSVKSKYILHLSKSQF